MGPRAWRPAPRPRGARGPRSGAGTSGSVPGSAPARQQKVLQPRGVAWGPGRPSTGGGVGTGIGRGGSFDRPGTGNSVSLGRRSSLGNSGVQQQPPVSFIPGGESSSVPLPGPIRPMTAQDQGGGRMPNVPKHIASPKGGGTRMRPLSAAGVFDLPSASGFIPQSWDSRGKQADVWENQG